MVDIRFIILNHCEIVEAVLYELAVLEAKENNKSHEEVLSDMAKRVPMHRLAAPEEIASVVLFLASKQASYVTGTTIQVDGGYTKGLL